MNGADAVKAKTEDCPDIQDNAPWWEHSAYEAALVELPTDFSLSSYFSYKEKLHVFHWEDIALLSDQPVDSSMLLLGVVQAWLYHYAKQKQVVLGFQVIGSDEKVLPVRVDLRKPKSFGELTTESSRVINACRRHPKTIGQVVEFLDLGRNDGHPALCPVIFRYSPEGPVIGEISDSRYLTIDVYKDGHAVSGTIAYSCNLFDPVTVERMEKQLHHILEIITADMDTNIDSIQVMPDDELQLLLGTWVDTNRDFDRHYSIGHRFETRVRQHPKATAVIFEDQEMDYQTLNRKANRLAHYLVNRGVCLDEPVGIYMNRCMESMVAYLAILKVGAVYLPLDVSFPKDRLSLMLCETKARIIFTHDAQVDTVPESNATFFNFDHDLPLLNAYSEENLDREIPGEIGSFIIYTSGSTGKPKGVFTTQQALLNFILGMQERNPLVADDRFLYKTSCCFDPAIMETTWPLLYGAAVVVARPEGHKDNTYLVRLIQEKKVTSGFTVPSALLPFFEEPGAENCISFRNFFTGGEAVPLVVAERFYEVYDGKLHNIYGPAETTVMVCLGDCRTRGIRTVPFGHPINNTKLYVLDEHDKPCLIGLSGEIYISGYSLGRGYIQRPRQTAQRFLPDPFTDQPGSRMYRTGDVVRYRANGELEFMGRNDSQIKIRGFRIELGEIESAIQRHPGVKTVVVVVHEPESGDKTLVAHWILNPGAEKDEICAFLKTKLPAYMVPTHYISHDNLPRTPTGKLDRSKLPKPALQRPDLTEPYKAPKTNLEKAVTAVWAETLNMEGIGVNDNFLNLGGHSLTAVKIIAGLRTKLNLELSLASLLEYPTISLLSRAIEKNSPTKTV